MTDIIIIAICSVILLFVLVLSVKKSGDTKSAESLRLIGDMIAQNQKNTDEYQSKKFTEIDKNITEKQAEMNKAVVNSLTGMETRFKTFEQTNEQKLDAMRELISKSLLKMQEDNSKKLEEMRQTVDEKLQKSLEENMTKSFKMVSERLEQVYKGLGEMQNLAVGVGDLKKVLSNVKTRGILGEIQLGAILKEILSPEQYDENAVTVPKSQNRVEFAVKLPSGEGTVYLPIDSKFPGDAFYELQSAYEAGDSEQVKTAWNTLSKRIKDFAKDIRDKYVEPPYTTDFAIMFLPFESLYAEVVNRGMIEILQNTYKIVVAGPSTMAALLNSLQMGFKTLAIQKRSVEVWNILASVKTEFDKFGKVLENTQTRIEQANRELDELVGVRTRAIQKKLKAVESIDAPSEALFEAEED